MTITINLDPEFAAKVRRLAEDSGLGVEEVITDLLEEQLAAPTSPEALLPVRPATPPAWLAELKPREPGGLADLFNKWPDEPNEAELRDDLGALKAMDDPKK